MAEIGADDIFKQIFLKDNFCLLIQNSIKFIPKGPNYISSSLVQLMACHRTGDKPLTEPMMNQFPVVYMQPQATMS